MAGFDEKENTAPLLLGPEDNQIGFSPFKKDDLKRRSKSIGPGGLQGTRDALQERLQHALNATVRGIIPDKEDAERKAARRKSMANRRVSFAPEATLHTWDVIEHMRDHTTSTEASEGLRRSPRKSAGYEYGSPSSQLISDDEGSSSRDGSSETGDEEDEEDEGDEDNTTGTAMSFATDAESTQASMLSGDASSTSSSLNRNLRLAADTAGTRGIEYDEFGEMSMELVGQDVTNAFQPWTQEQDHERRGSAVYDQENMLPFEFKAGGGSAFGDSTEQDISMDVTRAVGDIIYANLMSSPFAEIPMDLTQPIGGVASPVKSGQKRRRSAVEIEDTFTSPASRMGQRLSTIHEFDATMDFTHAVGGIRAPSETDYDANEELSMELTGVIGGIRGQLFGNTSQRVIEPSSPFREEVEATVTRAGMTPRTTTADEQSPTPLPNSTVSSKRSAARARRSATAEPETPALSSPAQRRSSRISARSPRTQGANTPLLIEPLSDRVVTPEQVNGLSPRRSSRSPRQQSTTPTRKARQVTEDIIASTTPRGQPIESAVRAVIIEQEQQDVRTPVQTAPGSGLMSTPKTATEIRSMMDNIKLMTTPRKEVLKPVTPKKATPSPSKRPRSIVRSQQRTVRDATQALHPELVQLAEQNETTSGVRLQDFLDQVGIRFMDLTTSKRRLTVATTPSRLRKTEDDVLANEEVSDITLEDAIVAASCTEPELELYKHACHELKRYIDEGKADMKILEAETLQETPVLIQAYISANSEQRAVLEGHLRDIKNNARLRSKEMWYGWRSNLIDDLMKALGSIAEDLLADDELLHQKENMLGTMSPLQEQRTTMQSQVEKLLTAVPRAEDREELKATRVRLQEQNSSLQSKRDMLRHLREQEQLMEAQRQQLEDVKDEYLHIISAAESKRASDQLVSGDQTARLKDAIVNLENDYEWSIVSASASPPTLTMCFKSQLELTLQPGSFAIGATSEQQGSVPAISLRYVGEAAPSTIARFFLRVLQAFIRAVDQSSTKLNEVLSLIASTWTSALELIETERLLLIESPVKVSIAAEDSLNFECCILLPKVRTKVCALLTVNVSLEKGNECDLSTDARTTVTYGEPYNEKNMTEFLKSRIADGFESWSGAIQQLRQKLIARGSKTEGWSGGQGTIGP